MRLPSLVLAGAASAVLAATPAAAGTAAPSASGAATSSVTLVEVAVGERTVSGGTLQLVADTTGDAPVARVVATPLRLDGQAVDEQTVTPGGEPTTVPAADSADLAGLARVQSPATSVVAVGGAEGPSTRSAASSLGEVELLGLPVELDGSLDTGSAVSAGGSLVRSALEVTGLALPSVADLLAAQGLDLAALPADLLVELVTALDLAGPDVQRADEQLDAARAANGTEQVEQATAGVRDAVTAVLDATPLLRLERLRVVTEAFVTGAGDGGQRARLVEGELAGLEVLGADVLDEALGRPRTDLSALVGDTRAGVEQVVTERTEALARVLSGVDGLEVPAPVVELAGPSLSPGSMGGFGTAETAVRGLRVRLPAVTLPTAVALPGAADLPAFAASGGEADSRQLLSSPVALTVGVVAERARFTAGPGAPGAAPPQMGLPGTGGQPGGIDQLPHTGPPGGLGLLGAALVGAALLLRRRPGAAPGP